MIPHPEITPAPMDEVPGPDLFMTVIKVRDWGRVLRWYVEMLGLMPMLTDTERQFALLAAGTGRLGLQADSEGAATGDRPRVRVVFLVPDVRQTHEGLIARGLEIEPPRENTREGFREIQLHDPEGTPLTLFSWTDAQRGRGFTTSSE